MIHKGKEFFARDAKRGRELLFVLALGLVALVGGLFVNLYPFASISPEALAPFLTWVQAFTPPSNPYKYWYPLALVGVPLGSYAVWRILCHWAGLTVTRDRLNPRDLYRPLNISPLSSTVVILVLALLLTNFSYSSFYVFFVNFHHLNYITGPLNDVLNGRLLLVDTKTQYGFLNIFLASWLFRGPLYFSHPNVHLLSMGLTVVEYAAYYLTLRGLCRSTRWAIAGILFTMSVHYYGIYPDLFPSETPLWPGNTWRFGWAAVASFAVLYWLNARTRTSFWLSQASVAVAFFWQMESGICLVGAYVACLFVECFVVDADARFPGPLGTRSFVRYIGSLACWGLGIAAAYSCYTYFSVGQFPDWTLLSYYTRIFNNGFFQGDHIPARWYWYWPVALYGICLAGIFGRIHLGWNFPADNLSFLVFTAVYGFGIFRYYLGYGNFNWRPVAIVVPACLLFVYFSQKLIGFFAVAQGRRRMFAGASLGLVVGPAFAFTGYHFAEWTFKINQHRALNLKEWRTPNYNVPELNRLISFEATTPSIPFTDLQNTLKNIERYVPSGHPIALIAYHDHSILMQSGRVNLAKSWYLGYDLYSKAELETLRKLFTSSAEYLFVEKELLAKTPDILGCQAGRTPSSSLLELFWGVREDFRFESDIGLLYVYRRRAKAGT